MLFNFVFSLNCHRIISFISFLLLSFFLLANRSNINFIFNDFLKLQLTVLLQRLQLMLLRQFQYFHKLTALFNTLHNSNIITIQILNQALIRIKRKLRNLNHRLIFRIQHLIKHRGSRSKHELMTVDIHLTLIPKILFSFKPERNITEIRLDEILGQVVRESVGVALHDADVVNTA